jgi:hypothetical protein
MSARVERLIGITDAPNVGSWRVIGKLGMREYRPLGSGSSINSLVAIVADFERGPHGALLSPPCIVARCLAFGLPTPALSIRVEECEEGKGRMSSNQTTLPGRGPEHGERPMDIQAIDARCSVSGL